MGDGCTHLRLDVVTNNWHTGLGELVSPFRCACNEDRKCIDKANARIDCTLCVEARCLLGSHGQVAHQHVHFALTEHSDDIYWLCIGLGDHLAVVLAETIKRVTALHH
ncbi:unannotated protein [freshwater metagenome]|uniref:Unannotated protein n=1 Tax=freshwater metagenome TaxID=449393 RepID=A0A6J7IV23_9ZZZZ